MCISTVADKNLTNVGLDVGANQGDDNPTRSGRTRVPTTPFKDIETSTSIKQ